MIHPRLAQPSTIMAIYQFPILIIPRKSVLEKYGHIPAQLEIKEDEWDAFWENYVENDAEDAQPDFEDARTIKWWKNTEINIKYLEHAMDQIITRAAWVKNSDWVWKSEQAAYDHDVYIDFDETANMIEEFQFRLDLTDSSLVFLNSMLDLCVSHDWILMDFQGHLCLPNLPDLVELIKISNAARFLSDPYNFLNTLKKPG
ncbi:MAG: hypothetical protein WCR52_03085 [Bacteroidota bacterium]